MARTDPLQPGFAFTDTHTTDPDQTTIFDFTESE